MPRHIAHYMDIVKPAELPSYYHVYVTGNLVVARIQGEWGLTTAIEYFTKLTQAISSVQPNPWASLVDMRGWALNPSVIASKDSVKLELDRRNQLAECWMVEPHEPNDSLARFPLLAGIPLYRVPSLEQGIQNLKKHSIRPENGWDDFAIEATA